MGRACDGRAAAARPGAKRQFYTPEWSLMRMDAGEELHV